jgi:hypothetical protein
MTYDYPFLFENLGEWILAGGPAFDLEFWVPRPSHFEGRGFFVCHSRRAK